MSTLTNNKKEKFKQKQKFKNGKLIMKTFLY